MLARGTLHTAFRLFRLAMMAGKPSAFLKLMLGKSAVPVPLRVPLLSPEPVFIRPGASDRSVLYATLWGGFDDVPACVPVDSSTRIWDLGANIGLVTALMATRRPLARITAVELDVDNAALARRNVRFFGERCDVITGAVWRDDGTVEYVIAPGREQQARASNAGGGLIAQSRCLNTLLLGDPWVDFIKMDIEGAEQEVLRQNTEWAARVGCIKVECHSPYSRDDGGVDLKRLGYEVSMVDSHPSSVLGIRPRFPRMNGRSNS